MIAHVLRGSLGFAAVSVAAFSVWAFGPLKGAAMYAAITAVFVALTGFALHRLAPSPRVFAKAFVPAFVAYAAAWSLAYVLLRVRGSDYLATALASAVFTGVLGLVLGGLRAWPKAAAVTAAAHLAGYWAGAQICYANAHSVPSMLAWGLFYGLGFGAGIGYAFRVFQLESEETGVGT